MTIHLFSGFLGSGKTTAIKQACTMLVKRGVRLGVITNDQGSVLVDGFVFRSMGVPEKQVGDGCFCCRYDELDHNIESLINEYQPQVLFAESVGTCTDLLATVQRPLRKFRREVNVTLTTVADVRVLSMMLKQKDRFNEEVRYIFFKQLEEAGILLLNKIDLLRDDELQNLIERVHQAFPGKQVIAQNSLAEEETGSWLNHVNQEKNSPADRYLSIDYDQYARGEAMMGFLDSEILFSGKLNNAEEAAVALIGKFTAMIDEAGLAVGHIKFWIGDRYKISFTASAGDAVAGFKTERSPACRLIVNARVQAGPDVLQEIMQSALQNTERNFQVESRIHYNSSFKPGYPRPLHRMV